MSIPRPVLNLMHLHMYPPYEHKILNINWTIIFVGIGTNVLFCLIANSHSKFQNMDILCIKRSTVNTIGEIFKISALILCSHSFEHRFLKCMSVHVYLWRSFLLTYGCEKCQQPSLFSYCPWLYDLVYWTYDGNGGPIVDQKCFWERVITGFCSGKLSLHILF